MNVMLSEPNDIGLTESLGGGAEREYATQRGK